MFRFHPYDRSLVLLVLGVIWCIAIFMRRHEDIEAIKVSKDNIEKSVIVGFWVLTAFIAAAICKFGPGVMGNLL